MKIIVSGGWGYTNVGDSAIAQATISLLNRYFPKAEKVYTSYDTDEFMENHRIKAIPSIHKIIESAYSENSIDPSMFIQENKNLLSDFENLFDENTILFMSGGGYVFGNWDIQIFSQLLEMEIAKRRGAKIYSVGQSIGPIYNEELRKQFIDYLNQIDVICVRDKYSKKYLVDNGVTNKIGLIPDLAAILSDVYPISVKQQETVSLFIAGFYSYQNNTNELRRTFFNRISQKVKRRIYKKAWVDLIRAIDCKYKINVVQSNSWEVDSEFADSVLRKAGVKKYSIARNNDMSTMVNEICKSKYVISCKMHPLIIAASYGIPCAGISYNYKMTHFMDISGLNDCCINIEQFDSSKAVKLFKKLESTHYKEDKIDKLKIEIYSRFEEFTI